MGGESDYSVALAAIFFASFFVWLTGLVVGNFFALRSAYQSSGQKKLRVFRGLAEPWGGRVMKIKLWISWLITFTIPTLGFFLFHILLSPSIIKQILYTPVALLIVFISFTWAFLVGFQKTIFTAENFFSMMRSPARKPTITTTATSVIVVEKKAIKEGEANSF